MRRRQQSRYRDVEDRGALIRARLLAFATLITGGAYLIWVYFALNRAHPIVAGAFYFAEVICFLLFVVASFTVWRLRYKPEEGLPIEVPSSVDVFICVCREPIEIVSTTIEAAAAIDWPGPLTIYVLDDGGDEQVRAAADRCGCTYLSRPALGLPVDRAKAGNLNFGLRNSRGELVLVLDADQVPRRSILRALGGYMRFPRVGFIQSRQMYLVPEGDPFFNLDRVFYEAVQLGYDNRDHVISCGSGVLYRRAALVDIGGFSSWNVVEDLTTSLELHSHGWQSFYYPYAVTTGLAPSEIWGVYRQRSQWALDTMRIWIWDNPLFKSGLRWAGRMSYLVIPLSYASAAFVFPLFFVIPLWTYITGATVLDGNEIHFAVMRGTYFAAMALALRALFRRHEAGRQFQMLVGLFPVYVVGTLRALLYPPGRGPRYRPNNARNGRARRPAALAVLPQLLLLAGNVILPFYAIFANTAAPRIILSNALISAAAIWSLLPVVFAALGRPVWDELASPYALYGRPANIDS